MTRAAIRQFATCKPDMVCGTAVAELHIAKCMQVSDVVAGLEWLALNYRAPAVVTMSLGVKVSP